MSTPATPLNAGPGAEQLTVKLVQGSQSAAIVLGGRGAGSWNDQAGAEAWLAQAWGSFRELMSTQVQCVGAVLRSASAIGDQVIELGPPADPVGGRAGAIAVASACTLIKWNTDTGGRSGKGRTFLPGLTADAVGADGRTYTAAYATLVATRVTQYLESPTLAATGLTPAVLSFTRSAAYPITSGALGAVVGMQRRRMRG